MKLARQEQSKYKYQGYHITIDFRGNHHYLRITDEKEKTLPYCNKLVNHGDWYKTENEAVLDAQEIIEHDMLRKTDKEKLLNAVIASLEKWDCVYEYSKHLDQDAKIVDILDLIDDLCGFCEQFQTCRDCPVRTKCIDIQRTSDLLQENYEEDYMSIEEFKSTIAFLAEDTISYLKKILSTYL